MSNVRLSGYAPGAIGRVTELHAIYYHNHWGFSLFFESKVAIELSEFLHRFKEERDGFWVASLDGRMVGSIAIDGLRHESQGAHLRWFIVAPESQGQGIGKILIEKAIKFSREKRFGQIYLWTFAGLDTARHLYERHGFRLSRQCEGDQWGKTVTEQMFELMLG